MEHNIQNESTAKARLAFLDIARGLAAFLVMFQHSMEAAGFIGLERGDMGSALINFGQTGVLIFFLVSGFVIPLSLEKKRSLTYFWVSRIFRLYPMYLLAFVLGCLTLFDFSRVGLLTNFVSHLFFIQEYVVGDSKNFVPNSWTLLLEIVWYIGFAALFVLGLNKKSALLAFLCAGGIIALCALSYALKISLPMGRVGILATCLCGLLFYRLQANEISLASFLAWGGLVVAAIGAGLVFRFYLMPDGEGIDFTLLCVMSSWALAYAVFGLLYWTRHIQFRMSGPLATLGAISYSFYLLHSFFIHAAERLHIGGAALIVFVFVTSVAASLLTYRYVEVPAINMGRALLEKMRMRQPAAEAVPARQ